VRRRGRDPELLREALRHVGQALALYREIGFRINEARALILLGDVVDAAGTLPSGERHRRAAHDLAATIGVPEATLPRRVDGYAP
jgi:hypothetical protein